MQCIHSSCQNRPQKLSKLQCSNSIGKLIRLKENNGKEEDEEEEKVKEKEEKPNEEEKKETCDNIELSSRRRTSPRNKKGLQTGSKIKGQSSPVADSFENHDSPENQNSFENHDSLENQDSFENHDSDPELPPPVPVLPPLASVIATNVTDSSKSDSLAGENDPTSVTEDADIVTGASLTDTPQEQKCKNSEEQAPTADLFAVGQNAGKSGGRKKLNRISVDRLEVPPTPPS